MENDEVLNAKLYKKAQADFDKALGKFAMLYYELTCIVYEPPVLYYSEEVAKRGLKQPQTIHYLNEASQLKKLLAAKTIATKKQYQFKPKK